MKDVPIEDMSIGRLRAELISALSAETLLESHLQTAKDENERLKARLADHPWRSKCYCGGGFAGIGRDASSKDVTFECNECGVQYYLPDEVWRKANKEHKATLPAQPTSGDKPIFDTSYGPKAI